MKIADPEIPDWVIKTEITRSDVQLHWATEYAKSNPYHDPKYTDSYSTYLRSLSWKWFRAAVMIASGRICADCKGEATEVHHLTYKRVGNELLSDVVPLCRACHEHRHGGIYRIALDEMLRPISRTA